jgi:hypothetical protein
MWRHWANEALLLFNFPSPNPFPTGKHWRLWIARVGRGRFTSDFFMTTLSEHAHEYSGKLKNQARLQGTIRKYLK